MRRLLGLLLTAVVLVLSGCSTSKEAVAVGGDFQFVAPGGERVIYYDPPADRGTVSGLSGESLQNPGTAVGLADHLGEVVVLNVWGTWCTPCREEMPDLQFVQDQTADLGVTVLGIDIRDRADPARDFLRDRAITFDSIYDPAGRTLAQLRGYPRNVVPSTIVLDREHRVAAVFLAQIRVPELIPLVERLSKES